MVKLWGILASLACLFWAAPDQSVNAAEETREAWEGTVFTATFRAGMCHDANGKAHGVLILRHASGQEDQYHLYGTIRNNEFELSHSSGHHFTGKFKGADRLEGKAKLKNGVSMTLKGKRSPGAFLKMPDCAPLS